MKKSIGLFVLTIYFTSLSYCQSSIREFEWLKGNWKRTHETNEKVSYESWVFKNNELHGLGVTLNKEDTIFIERLKIKKIKDEYYYIADVAHNPTPIKFKVTSFSINSFIVENPLHDFPKKIEYQVVNNILRAQISDGDKIIEFTLYRYNE